MSKDKWVWMPHPGHFILAQNCRFRLNTYVNGFIVSTVGELWPDQDIRRIYAQQKVDRYDPECEKRNRKIFCLKHDWHYDKETIDHLLSLRGDYFDDKYMELFGFHPIGINALYETMVFFAEKNNDPLYQCCPWTVKDWSEIEMRRYTTAEGAYKGHMDICEAYDLKNVLHEEKRILAEFNARGRCE